jgi:hypothetical protein
MTLGPVLMILSWIENSKSKALETVSVFGRVPLFYYILHFFMAHAIALTLFIITTGTPWSQIDFSITKGLGGIPRGTGYSLIWTHVAWIGVVLVTYPLCKWYDRYKTMHKSWWLSYL